MRWSIAEHVQHLDSLYGINNRERGLDKAALRLVEEAAEAVSTLLIDAHDPLVSPEAFAMLVAQEIADTFAWTFTISAMMDVDIDTITARDYCGVHKRCGNRPCTCGPFHWYASRATPNSQVAGR